MKLKLISKRLRGNNMKHIIISKPQKDSNFYKISQGDKYTTDLCFDEMLAQLISLTFPADRKTPFFGMMTKAEHKKVKDHWKKVRMRNKAIK